MLDWTCVRDAGIGLDSYYIISTIKPTPKTCIRVTIVGVISAHNRFEITIVTTCDNRVAIIKT